MLEKGHKLSRGGKRKGAGRKPNVVKELAESADAVKGEKAAEYLNQIAAMAEEKSNGGKVRLAALIYLTDRILGKPKQQVDLGGGLNIPLAITMNVVGPKRG